MQLSKGGWNPTDKPCVVSTHRRVPTNWVSGRKLQPYNESVVASTFVPSDFLVDGQVSGLGTVQPHLTLDFFSTWILPLNHVFFFLILCSKPFGDWAMDDGGWLRIELAASGAGTHVGGLGLIAVE